MGGGDKSDLLAEGVFPEELTYLGQEPAWVGGCSFLQPLSLPSPGTPKGVDFTTVRDLLLSVEGVEALHSLHIWALTVAQPVLSVHIAIGEWLGYAGWGDGERQPEAWGVSEASSDLRCLQCLGIEPGRMLSILHTLFHSIIRIPFRDKLAGDEVGYEVTCPGF